eukprot:TRINITY_DN941_c0_g1_i3.p1 TRINITY_DN941_c0_g1~~TRINITY_DN941_c0_g1_i3.p1  ORF type:complete len:430 (-),score=82.24 TRINITY_DN941_c0_g1_i3:171-1460(-)
MLVSFAEGTVKSTPGYDKIKALESFVSLETTIEPGSRVDRTVDIFTSVGSVILMHHDSAILKHDYDAIRRMEIDCQLFEFEAVAWRLAELGVLTNGVSDGRRDKKVQQELVKAAGLRSVRQAGGTKLSDVEDFLASEPMPVVVKPVESAGSDGVKLCTSIEDAKAHFELLMSSQRKVGSQNASVLCQEFLKGKEYVIDHISRDGVHKTTMVWVYDKRRANGGDFVYYGMIPVDVNSKEAKEMIPYVRGVLDALGIKNGPTHGEVMMTQRGACLVEMNCRAHGGDGAWNPLAMELTGGFSQVNGTIDAYTSADKFAKIPDLPPSPFKAVGQNLMLVSFAEGTVKSTPGYDKIKALESFVSLETTIEPGSRVDRTIDIFTSVGSVILMHHDEEVLKRDYNAIRQMEVDCALFDFKPEAVLLGRPRARSDSL